MFHSAALAPFGYNMHIQRPYNGFDDESANSGFKLVCALRIITNFSGYIPIIGAISSVAKSALLGFGLYVVEGNLKEVEKPFVATFTVRNILEFAGCGVLFIIPDIIVTIGRALTEAPDKAWFKYRD